MSKMHGKFKLVTTAGTGYAEKLSHLVDQMSGGEVLAVYEFNSVTNKYRPNKSAYSWLCGKRGQEIEMEEKPETEFARIFKEMRELMDEMGYTQEERRKAVDNFVTNLPIKGAENEC